MTSPGCARKGLVEEVRAPATINWRARVTRSAPSSSKLFENLCAPTAGLLAPFRGDCILAEGKRGQLDRLYQRICDNLDALLTAVGLKVAA